MDISNRTRGEVIAAVAQVEREKNRNLGKADGERRAESDAAKTKVQAFTRVKAWALKKSDEDWKGRTFYSRALNDRDRGYLTDALDELVAEKLLESEPAARGIRYRRP